MKNEISDMLISLKARGISVAAVEKEIEVANGLLGKVVKGDRTLTDEKFKKLENVFRVRCHVAPPIEKKTQLAVNGNGELKQIPTKPMMKRADEVMEKLNKRFGEGTVMKFGQKQNVEYQVISTGSFGLDKALGIWGLPRGRIVEIFGWEATGKSTITLNVIANAQKQGLRTLFIDAESAFDPEYAEALGVNIEELNFCQPSCGEEALEVADSYISSGKIDVCVIDSVAALVPKAELSGEHGESKMGLHARLMSQACRKLTGIVSKNNVLLIFTNQLRLKIGVVFGDPTVTTGGMALQFYASVRIKVSRSIAEANSITNNGVKEGNETTVKVIKNKCAKPFLSATFNILYGSGVDKSGEILDAAIAAHIIKKEGTTYWYNKAKMGVGYDTAKSFLDDNEGLRDEIENKLKQ